MSKSENNIIENIRINSESEKHFKDGFKKFQSPKGDHIKKEIMQKLNEGTILHFIRNSNEREYTKLNLSENEKFMKYDLSMINKYNEDLNPDLSFISEFDLEQEENKNDNSFNSSFEDNSVEEIEIIKK